ncbi:hypothetical protein MTR67_051980 [Solanum verrucosum]|uniref:Integrase catalytic domain-containing protein n=1 Tax=Solanum verrucosum TaxID=315347 RepID=A0AAF1A2W9_SOLVR|nr:hypothetical protein MTR67_051980 [Solanum verrucosum]
MYQTIKEHYWWNGMKKDIAEFISKYLVCQKVKAKHQVPVGLLQPLWMPEWKWERITMDFLYALPCTQRNHDAIWVIVDRLTKSAHFLAIRMDYSQTQGLHLDFGEALGTKLKFSTSFHPQTDDQSERVLQILEDMLRACIMEFEGSWDKHLAWIEIAYNSSYQSSIGMPPYEALYRRKCQTPLCWSEVGERKLVGPEIVQQTETR